MKPPGNGEQDRPITRLQMIEYISVRVWWTEGQWALMFTALLWGSFALIVWLRMDIEAAFEVNESLEQYFMHVIAEPSQSGLNPRPPEEHPVPCRCACQGASLGEPVGPCGGKNAAGQQAEVIDLFGMLPLDEAERLGLQPGGQDVAPVMHWDNISDVSEAWYWITHGVVPGVWNPQSGRAMSSRPGLLLRRNLVIGGMRVRQTRAKPLDKCDADEGLLVSYPPRCRSEEFDDSDRQPDSFALNFTSQASQDAAISAFKPVGGEFPGVYDAMLDVEKPMEEVLETVQALASSDWVDDMTRQVQVQTLFLNAEVGIYTFVLVTLDFPPDGGVVKDVRARSLIVLDTTLTLMDFLPEIVWACLIIMLIRQELMQVCISCARLRFSEYITDLWNVLDWISIFLGVPVAFFWWAIALQTYGLTDGIVSLPRAPLANVDMSAHRKAWGSILDDAKDIFNIKQFHAFCMFWYTVVITMRFLKNFLTQQKLALIQFAIANAFWDVLHFLIMYFVTFANFVLGGRILFGPTLVEWSSFTRAASSALRMMMGHFEFEDMYEIAPVSATVWFWLFLLTMIFLLSNVLLVIIADHFHALRDAVGETPSIFHDAYLGVKDLLWRLSWRYEAFKEEEYCNCLCRHPYYTDDEPVIDSLMEASEVNEDFKQAARESSLGVRLIRKKMENSSLMGLANDGTPGGFPITQLQLRGKYDDGTQRSGVDPYAADHLLEECREFVQSENPTGLTQVEQVRHLVVLLEKHKEILNEHCTNIEFGVDEEKEHLWQTLKRLEKSVRKTLTAFSDLRESGVETLAPPLPGVHKQMMIANKIEEQHFLTDGDGFYDDGFRDGTDNMLRDAARSLELTDGQTRADRYGDGTMPGRQISDGDGESAGAPALMDAPTNAPGRT